MGDKLNMCKEQFEEFLFDILILLLHEDPSLLESIVTVMNSVQLLFCTRANGKLFTAGPQAYRDECLILKRKILAGVPLQSLKLQTEAKSSIKTSDCVVSSPAFTVLSIKRVSDTERGGGTDRHR